MTEQNPEKISLEDFEELWEEGDAEEMFNTSVELESMLVRQEPLSYEALLELWYSIYDEDEMREAAHYLQQALSADDEQEPIATIYLKNSTAALVPYSQAEAFMKLFRSELEPRIVAVQPRRKKPPEKSDGL